MKLLLRKLWIEDQGQGNCRVRGNVGRHPGSRGRYSPTDRVECQQRILERCEFTSVSLKQAHHSPVLRE